MNYRGFKNRVVFAIAGLAMLFTANVGSGQFYYPGQVNGPSSAPFGTDVGLFGRNNPGHGNWYWPNVHWPSRFYYFSYGYPQREEMRVIPPMAAWPVGRGQWIVGDDRPAPFMPLIPEERPGLPLPAVPAPPVGGKEEAPPPATLQVRVPTRNAAVWFEGVRTGQEGRVRNFVTPSLIPGQGYRYEIRARWLQGGRVVQEVRTVQVRSGERVSVDFTKPVIGSQLSAFSKK